MSIRTQWHFDAGVLAWAPSPLAREKRECFFFWSLQAELWVNPGPRGGVDPRQRARAQMPVSLVYWEDAATGTSARSGQGRERIEEDARVRAYAAYGLDGAE